MTCIRRMVFTGFKSFAKRTEFLFGDRFNVIAGPNGSGKSNVIDGICFVLGKSSAKSLRAEKSSNLIYNGGKKKQGAKAAEVSIYFDNAKKTFPTDIDQVKITRVVKISGQSVYKINDEVRTRQQVLDLLSLANINPDGYNIVLQGDIIHIVEMSPLERRGIIEEIAGISQYEEKKQKALLELEKVDQKLQEAEIILKERQAYLRELKKERDQALKYQSLNNKIRGNKASFLKRQITKKSEECVDWEKKVNGEKAKLAKLSEKILGIKEKIQKKKDDVNAILGEIEKSGEVEQIVLQKQVETLRVAVATNKTRIQSSEQEIGRITQRKEQLDHVLGEIVINLSKAEGELIELVSHKKRLQDERKELENRLIELRKKHHLDEQAVDIEKRIGELDHILEEKDRGVQELRETQQNLLREKDKIEIHLQTVDDRIKKVEIIESEHTGELRALKQKKEEFKKSTLELNQLLTADSSLAQTMARSRQELYAAREELSKLEAKQAGIRESTAGNIAIQKILERKKDMQGIFGTVAELGEVKAKYALALETAAGPRMKSIVVIDDRTAAECIRYLKDNRFGTASFLPLNKIRSQDSEKKLDKLKSAAGVEGVATDLIKFSPDFKNVFSYVFGNTLIVDDITVARKIGIGEARMATLEGDLCETSGAMIGGFHERKKHGGFREQELGDDLEKISERVVDLDTSVQKYENERRINEDRIAVLRELKANLEADIIKTEKSMHLESTDLEASQAYKEELKKQGEQIDGSLSALQDDIIDKNRNLAQLKIEKQKLRDAIMQLKNPAVVAELNAYDQKIRDLTTSVIQSESDAKNVRMRIDEIYKKEEENTKKILKDLDKDHAQFQQDVKQLRARVHDEEKLLKVEEEKQHKFYARHKELYDKRASLQDEINSLDSTFAKEDEQSRQVEYTVNTMSLEVARHRAEKAGLDQEFEQYSGVELDLAKPEEILKKEIAEFEKMKETIGMVNMRALEMYDRVEQEYQSILEKKATLGEEKTAVLTMMEEIESKKKELFIKNYEIINTHFQRIFSQLTTKGGAAALALEVPDDPFAGGVTINVKVTGDKVLDIRSLSGGEKTMTALAFLFAIQEHEPASFYVFDEVDAALDTNNSAKLGKLIGKYSEKAQYVVISHHDSVITEAEFLYGVSMNEDGMSNVVSLKV